MAERTCGHHACGKVFETDDARKRYCTKRCKGLAHDHRRYIRPATTTCPKCDTTFQHRAGYKRPRCPECARLAEEARNAGKLDLRKGIIGEDTGRDISGGLYKEALRHDPCAYCPAPAAHIDHIVPRDQAGPDSWDNLTGACSACNSSKRNLSLLSYLLARKILHEIKDDTDALAILIVRRKWPRNRHPWEIAELPARYNVKG